MLFFWTLGSTTFFSNGISLVYYYLTHILCLMVQVTSILNQGQCLWVSLHNHKTFNHALVAMSQYWKDQLIAIKINFVVSEHFAGTITSTVCDLAKFFFLMLKRRYYPDGILFLRKYVRCCKLSFIYHFSETGLHLLKYITLHLLYIAQFLPCVGFVLILHYFQ